MAYKKSTARIDFDTELDSILSVVAAAPRYGLAQEYVLSCAILFCSAKIESYIEDVFDLIADAISNTPIVVSKLPIKLRAFLFGLDNQIVSNYSNFIAHRDEKKLIDGMSRFFNNHSSTFSNPDALLPKIPGSRIYNDCKYPSPENLSAMFTRLGIKIFTELNRRAHRDVELDLTSFNSLRTSLAHSALSPSINARDIKRHIRLMRELVALLDRVLYGFTCAINGQALWLKSVCK